MNLFDPTKAGRKPTKNELLDVRVGRSKEMIIVHIKYIKFHETNRRLGRKSISDYVHQFILWNLSNPWVKERHRKKFDQILDKMDSFLTKMKQLRIINLDLTLKIIIWYLTNIHFFFFDISRWAMEICNSPKNKRWIKMRSRWLSNTRGQRRVINRGAYT